MPVVLPGDKQNLAPNVGCPGSAHSCSAQGQQSGWTGGCFGTENAAAHKSREAMPSLLCSVVTSPPVWDLLPAPNLATGLVLSLDVSSLGPEASQPM